MESQKFWHHDDMSQQKINLKIILTGLLLSVVLATVNGQSKNRNDELVFHEFNYEDTSVDAYRFLRSFLQNKRVVGLAEVSHGTQEFYVAKSALSKYLIQELGFNQLAFEMDEQVAKRVNQYVQDRSPETIADDLRGYGLYDSKALFELFKWIKLYNDNQKDRSEKVRIIGFDSQEYWADPMRRDRLMSKQLLDQMGTEKTILWAHQSHLVKSDTWDVGQSGVKAMGNYIAAAVGDDYYLITFDTQEGELSALDNGELAVCHFKMNKSLLNPLLDQYFVEFSQLDDPLMHELSHLSSERIQEPIASPVRLGVDLDALFFIRSTSPSIPIEKSEKR